MRSGRSTRSAVEAARAQQRGVEDVGPFVAAIKMMLSFGSNPSISRGACSGLLALVVPAAEAGTAVSPDRVDLVHEDDPRGHLLACSNRSRTRGAPTPTNISTKSEPEIEKNGTPPRRDRASEEGLPVPGGP